MPVFMPIIKKDSKGFFSTKENDAGGMTYVFSATEGGGGGGSMEGFHMVRFFNDDQTTLLYTVYVPDGSSAIYAGETPVSTKDEAMIFYGFEPAAVNVTKDLDCYAYYDLVITTLDAASWKLISKLSANGEAQNYFAIGDTKMIHIEGTVGTLNVIGDYGVYIIGFDHNEVLEGKGIHFGTFKTAVSKGTDVCLIDAAYYTNNTGGQKCFNMTHWGNSNYGGWAGCDMRYDILGSTDVPPSGYGSKKTNTVVGYDATETCATNPVAGTLMAALPADLRAVMKPMTKYTDNKGDYSNSEADVSASVDYLPFLAVFEISAKTTNTNRYEANSQAQYAYYAAGKSKYKYKSTDTSAVACWWTRSPNGSVNYNAFGSSGSNFIDDSGDSYGLAPIFKV